MPASIVGVVNRLPTLVATHEIACALALAVSKYRARAVRAWTSRKPRPQSKFCRGLALGARRAPTVPDVQEQPIDRLDPPHWSLALPAVHGSAMDTKVCGHRPFSDP